MRLYYLQNAVNNSDTGTYYPQVETLFPKLDYGTSNSISGIYNQESDFSTMEPKVDYAILKYGAKFSDFLSASMFVLNGFLVSEKAKSFFDRHNLPKHKYYAVPVRQDEQMQKYYWLHMLFFYKNSPFKVIELNNIEWNKSSFIIEKDLKYKTEIKISSPNDIVNAERELEFGEYITASILTLRKKILDESPDIFKLPILNMTEWIVKEHVKHSLVSSGLTGYKLTEITNLIIE